MTIKGPAIFLAQFAGDKEPFNTLENITKWAADLGYKGVQIPTWDSRMIDLKQASESKDYCDELKGICKKNNVEISELSTHLQGQLVAVHPAYDIGFDQFAPAEVNGGGTVTQVVPTQVQFGSLAAFRDNWIGQPTAWNVGETSVAASGRRRDFSRTNTRSVTISGGFDTVTTQVGERVLSVSNKLSTS